MPLEYEVFRKLGCAFCGNYAEKSCECRHGLRYCDEHCQRADWPAHKHEHSAPGADVSKRLKAHVQDIARDVLKRQAQRQKALKRTFAKRQKQRPQTEPAKPMPRASKQTTERARILYEMYSGRNDARQHDIDGQEQFLAQFEDMFHDTLQKEGRGLSADQKKDLQSIQLRLRFLCERIVLGQLQGRNAEVYESLNEVESLSKRMIQIYTGEWPADPTAEEMREQAYTHFKANMARHCEEEAAAAAAQKPAQSAPVNAKQSVGMMEGDQADLDLDDVSEASEFAEAVASQSENGNLTAQFEDGQPVVVDPTAEPEGLRFGAFQPVNALAIDELLREFGRLWAAPIDSEDRDEIKRRKARLNELFAADRELGYFRISMAANSPYRENVASFAWRYDETLKKIRRKRTFPGKQMLTDPAEWPRWYLKLRDGPYQEFLKLVDQISADYGKNTSQETSALIALLGCTVLAGVGWTNYTDLFQNMDFFNQPDFWEQTQGIMDASLERAESAKEFIESAVLNANLFSQKLHEASLYSQNIDNFMKAIIETNPGGMDPELAKTVLRAVGTGATVFREQATQTVEALSANLSPEDAVDVGASRMQEFSEIAQTVRAAPVATQAEQLRALADALEAQEGAGLDASLVAQGINPANLEQGTVDRAAQLLQIEQDRQVFAQAQAAAQQLVTDPETRQRMFQQNVEMTVQAAQPMRDFRDTRPLAYKMFNMYLDATPEDSAWAKFLFCLDDSFGLSRLESIVAYLRDGTSSWWNWDAADITQSGVWQFFFEDASPVAMLGPALFRSASIGATWLFGGLQMAIWASAFSILPWAMWKMNTAMKYLWAKLRRNIESREKKKLRNEKTYWNGEVPPTKEQALAEVRKRWYIQMLGRFESAATAFETGFKAWFQYGSVVRRASFAAGFSLFVWEAGWTALEAAVDTPTLVTPMITMLANWVPGLQTYFSVALAGSVSAQTLSEIVGKYSARAALTFFGVMLYGAGSMKRIPVVGVDVPDWLRENLAVDTLRTAAISSLSIPLRAGRWAYRNGLLANVFGVIWSLWLGSTVAALFGIDLNLYNPIRLLDAKILYWNEAVRSGHNIWTGNRENLDDVIFSQELLGEMNQRRVQLWLNGTAPAEDQTLESLQQFARQSLEGMNVSLAGVTDYWQMFEQTVGVNYRNGAVRWDLSVAENMAIFNAK
jgi:hypothetical protein